MTSILGELENFPTAQMPLVVAHTAGVGNHSGVGILDTAVEHIDYEMVA
jgi:hypothetical protein